MVDQKTSLLINRQVPEYVREEHPLFIAFLEAYYEFLETKQGQKNNDLITKSKELRNISDVDESLDDFEINFFNTFAEFIPKDTEVSKEFLLKNVLPLYLSKGSEKSFKFLFRLMFGEELDVLYPKNEVLRASDGKWMIERALKTTGEIYSFYTGDGTTVDFTLLAELEPQDVIVSINGVLQVNGWSIRKEIKKIFFQTAPADGAQIKVSYIANLDESIVENREVRGVISKARGLVERVEQRNVFNKRIYDLFIDEKNVVGEFTIGEDITTQIVVNDTLVDVRTQLASFLNTIKIIDGGSNYNVSDPVIINTLFSDEPATAFVSKTAKGVIDTIGIIQGGAGFQIAKNVIARGIDTSLFSIAISEVDTDSQNTANTFTISSDVISHIDPANTLISSTDYGFDSGLISSPNAQTVLAQAFSNISYTLLGEISNIQILNSEVSFSLSPDLDAEPATVTIANTGFTIEPTTVKIDTFGSLGKMVLVDGGFDYEKGDELVFHNKPMSFGIGAAAEVLEVNLVGTITKVSFVPARIEGTANVTSVSNVMVHGIGTAFERDLLVGDTIMIGGESRNVVSIASNTSLNVDSTFSEIYIDFPIRKEGLYLLGGQNYKQSALPTITVNSENGYGANIIISAIMGDGEQISARGEKRPGEIEEITVFTPGEGFTSIPTIDMSGYGDGNALLQAELVPSFEVFAGKWITSDSILSSTDRKLQGKDYYQNYTYLLSSNIQFAKYKQVFRDLLHPAGFKGYAQYNKIDTIEVGNVTIESANTTPETIRTISGRANIVNGSITVTGLGTRFELANASGILTIGTEIALDGQIRTVNNIVSNTQITVSEAFTSTANLQEVVILG
jgi:hypothetical protein